jgi:hypothetical protein
MAGAPLDNLEAKYQCRVKKAQKFYPLSALTLTAPTGQPSEQFWHPRQSSGLATAGGKNPAAFLAMPGSKTFPLHTSMQVAHPSQASKSMAT